MKKIMILGGSRFILPVIKTAHELGHYVVTCDYLPDNIAHRYSDEYINVSVVDEEEVLKVARKANIDGIMSFGCDPGVLTAAYVAEKLGLPSAGSYEAISILQNKGRFRKFLSDNHFNVPFAKSYDDIREAVRDVDLFKWPVIVKPTDSAGSKGVTKVETPEKLQNAIECALGKSRRREFIIEEYLEKVGCSSDSDSFSVNGEFKIITFNSQRFDEHAQNPFTPSAYSWPATITDEHQLELKAELQRLIKLLGLKSSIYNIETRECIDGKAYIMECSPRGGGNRLAEMIKKATGVDLVRASIEAAIDGDLSFVNSNPYDVFWSIVILHGDKAGRYHDLSVSDEIKDSIIEKDIWVEPGDVVNQFRAANDAIGTLVMKFNDEKQMLEVIDNPDRYIKVLTY